MNDISPRPQSPATYSLSDESQLLLSLYTEVGSANFWSGFLERLGSVANLNGALFLVANVHSAELRTAWEWNVDLENIRNYITGGYAVNDDLIKYTSTAETGHFYSSEIHLAPILDYERDSEVYRNWVAPQGIHDVAMATFAKEGNWVTSMALYRQPDQGFFTADELRQFDRLIPHIRRAIQLHGDLIRSQSKPQELEAWLSMVKVPVLLFDGKSECSDHNAAARQFFAGQNAVRLEEGRIAFDDPALAGQVGYCVIHALKAAQGPLQGGLEILQLTEGLATPTTFVFMPVSDHLESAISSAGALVFIYQPAFTQGLDFSSVRDMFGLTPAELAVCSQLAQGLSVRDVAQYQGKSRETVRSQLKQVYSKTGTRNQAELVLSLLTHPSVLASG